jgi:hypothetical protein
VHLPDVLLEGLGVRERKCPSALIEAIVASQFMGLDMFNELLLVQGYFKMAIWMFRTCERVLPMIFSVVPRQDHAEFLVFADIFRTIIMFAKYVLIIVVMLYMLPKEFNCIKGFGTAIGTVKGRSRGIYSRSANSTPRLLISI